MAVVVAALKAASGIEIVDMVGDVERMEMSETVNIVEMLRL